MWVVTKPFEFQLVAKDPGSICVSGKVVFKKGDMIIGFHRESYSAILTIRCYDFNSKSFTSSFVGTNFNIEDYIELFTCEQSMDRASRGSETTKTVHLQIRLLDTECDVNKFLMTIPRERIVDVKKTIRAPNDYRFMVIYTEEK